MSLFPKRLCASRGFTLIELMITVAVIAILARLAMPSYLTYVKRSKLPPAFAQLSAYAVALQQYYQDNRTYVGFQEPLSSGVGLDCKNTGTDYTPTNSNFKYTCVTATSSAFKIKATGLSGTATDSFVFSITNDNVQSTDGAPSGWTTNSTCWVRDSSGSCN